MKKLFSAAVFAVCMAAVLSTPMQVKAETDIFLYIDEVCEQYQIDSSFVIAMCESESSLHYPSGDNLWQSSHAKKRYLHRVVAGIEQMAQGKNGETGSDRPDGPI